MQYEIQGELVPITPLHIASGEGGVRYDFKTRRKIYGQNGGVPLTTVQSLPYMINKEDRAFLDVPCIHANTIRGGIRRAGVRVVADILAENEEKVDMNTMLRMCAGTSSGRPNQSDPVSVEEMDEIFDNPFVGLFGGGERMHRSRMRTGTAIPILEELIELGAIPQVFEPMQASASELRSCIVLRRVDDILRNLPDMDEALSDVVEDFNRQAEERILAAARSRASRREGEEGDPRGDMLDSINALEFVNPGSRFYVRFAVHGAHHHVGMFLLALQEFYRRNAIGGWTRNDFGRFRFQDLAIWTEDGRKQIFEDGTHDLTDDMRPFLDAFDQARHLLNADSLERLLR